MKIEDIYPLTIVAMKHGKYVVIEGLAVYECVQSLQEDEEVQYDPDEFMGIYWSHIRYGIGDSVDKAFENFKYKYVTK